MTDVWCKSGEVPITKGFYTIANGTVVEVVGSKTGRFYAKANGQYQPGLIYRLRAELEKRVMEQMLQPFVDLASCRPEQAEDILREGQAFLEQFGMGVPEEDVPALVRAAKRYLSRNY